MLCAALGYLHDSEDEVPRAAFAKMLSKQADYWLPVCFGDIVDDSHLVQSNLNMKRDEAEELLDSKVERNELEDE